MTAVNLCPFDFGLEKIKRKRTTAAGGSKHDRLGAPRNSREARPHVVQDLHVLRPEASADYVRE